MTRLARILAQAGLSSFDQGRVAFLTMQEQTANPYTHRDAQGRYPKQAAAWQQGWLFEAEQEVGDDA